MKWASPAFAVPKPGGGYRLVIDFREVNSRSVAITWPMPPQDEILTRLSKGRYFLKLDLFKGFWGFPLAESSQEIFTFMTGDGTFTPLRLPQGVCKSLKLAIAQAVTLA